MRINKADGSVEVKNYTIEDGAVILAPDVQRYFPDSDSVNEALRCLIPIVSKRRQTRAKSV